MVGAVATGKVSIGALRKGMNIAKVFSNKKTFLEAHQKQTPAKSAAAAVA